jgi:uncharacterized cupredoxin-like copper-binding protein
MNRALLLAISAFALALAIAGCGSDKDSTAKTDSGATQSAAAAPAAAGNTVDASLKEWSITDQEQTVKAGKVTFNATNDGSAPHELVVLKTDKPQGDLEKNGEVSESDSVGEVSDIEPGASGKKTIDLQPGKYVLICNLPGHYAQGMHTSLVVK